ncbi:unnamed protein product [Prunus armeniaca]|uniref:Poly [ADP-ribose] polymerase n=1 Tax=Prunus armeniaca TaxID=36596 RepID=A0A6J5VQK6_PRUAR|nr:unnamed protein product [Prunus armeniaca]
MANPQPPKPWKVEYAKSSRSSCKTCKSPIEKEKLRLGKMVTATQFDGFMPMWNHADCIMKKAKQIKSTDDVEGLELLRWEDQKEIRNYVQSGGPPDTITTVTTTSKVSSGIEVSPTSRATCKSCSQKILKAEVRISTKPEGQGPRGLAWHHANCFMELSPSTEVEKLSGWETLPVADQAAVRALVKKVPSNARGGKKTKEQEDKEFLQQSTPSTSTKRRKDSGGDQKSKVARSEGDVSTSWDVSARDATDLESKLEAQTKELWALKDNLKKHVTTAELREMLEANVQDSTGSELDLRERCADGMMFGALSRCPICSGFLRYSGGMYRCHGYISEWSKCSYSTEEPERLKWKWKIPEDTDNHILISADTNCLVVSGALDDKDAEMRKARRMKLPIVREDYLVDCFKKQKKLPFDLYKVEVVGVASSMVTVKVKGRSAVHESSGLQDTCHILEDEKSIYNTTLSMSDLSTGVNSYYILQIIQDDKSSDCYVFRKWGRVGNDKIGGNKLEEMLKSDAICEFKRLFLEKTGNSWEAWEQKQNFQKQPGRFFPLDIDYGVNKQVSKKNQNNAASKLAPPLAELMKMLFNVETYRAAMMEFEINMSEMPLGKLSKSNIQKGFEALTEIQNLLNSNGHAPSMKESLIVDASNRFFTVIPSIHPHVIRDEDDFKSKVKMLEALQDIEIASRLVGFDADTDDSLDEKYRKLRCDIDPIPHDSEDFRLIKKYLLTTHAPTHTDWSLELEEVFALEREGEFDKFAPYRKKLNNRMLLWHGSRFTNFVGILSQGLRIAPPEAPATGYMFGKGIYFADLVSKSAQYCYTDKKNPVGLMLLSEVALGEVHELKKATYMDKPPKGKHSTKGLGKKIPQESEYVKWKDDVIVPCGKPVPSNIKASELMYNEYIVYDKAQVKMQFLLKVRFHHKR